LGTLRIWVFALHEKSKGKWDMHVNVNVQTNSLSKLPKCKGGLVSVFRKIDGLVDAKRRP